MPPRSAPERPLQHHEDLGAAIDLLRRLRRHAQHPLATWVPLILSGLREQRAHLALTKDQKPWGVAIWHWASPATHAQWLQQAPTVAGFAALPSGTPDADASASAAPMHLWFSVLCSPLGSGLPLLQELRQRLPQADQAWAITPYGAGPSGITLQQAPQVRLIW